MAFLRTPTGIWLLLVLATVGTFLLSPVAGLGLAAVLSGSAVALALAAFKGRLIALDFMEARHAPLAVRIILEVWLVLAAALVFAILTIR